MPEQSLSDDVSANCLATRIRLLNRAVTQIYDDALRPLELRVGQFTLLAWAERVGTLVPSEVCAELCMDASTISRTLERMLTNHWIEKATHPNPRVQPYRLTPTGAELLKQAYPCWQAAQAEARQLLGEMGVVLLKEVARKLERDSA
ncbi:MAG: MarR family winged helix-turn-helix transcriptional regulator [Pirellulales bacterium]|nr:MarR family winged helix-turn-helix transcriptional regulator [Pirellulales bacterium]